MTGTNTTNMGIETQDALRIIDTTERDTPLARKAVMVDVYSEGIGHVMDENTLRSITSVLRCAILPKKKFVDDGEGFGTFEKHDFCSEKHWASILYKKIPSLHMMTDSMKCKVWITYRKKIKEQFSLHRSAVTLKIKRAFINGKFNIERVSFIRHKEFLNHDFAILQKCKNTRWMMGKTLT